MGRTIALLMALSVVGCRKAGDVCPRPADIDDPPARGDANADGFVDVSDAVWLFRHASQGGPEPVCGDLDLIADNSADNADGMAVLYQQFTGTTTLDDGESVDCNSANPPDGAGCVDLEARIEGEKRVKAASSPASFPVTVRLVAPTVGISAWSLSARSTGCSITAATTAGTAAAELHSEAPGLRDQGFDQTEVTNIGALSAVVMSWWKPTTLPAAKDGHTVLTLTVSAPVPAKGCGECVVILADGQVGSGLAVPNVATIDGWSYPLPPAELTTKVCSD